ncbi:MAG TPA: maleylpyruvate isomerase N-terminal domain-containing protein, partial [Actinoplanes sp.]|nr:maleylpyruvate isomerase N-terminal domain-containing protein [Actinoplanes sp.]
IRERGELDAGCGPADLAERYRAALARLAVELPGIPPDRPIPMVAGHVLTLPECLLTRLVELLVHADDLAVSIGVPTPQFADEPADLVVSVLARVARRRHGTTPVLRALARRERATGSIAAF